MLEDLENEVEAINSIYGEETLQSSLEDGDRTFVLCAPKVASSVRIQFPPNYPEGPPVFLGTHRSGDQTTKGEAAHALELYRESTTRLFRPGEVCLYDVIEDVISSPSSAGEKATQNEMSRDMCRPLGKSQLVPAWTVSDVVVELKSVFLARCAPVTSPAEAGQFRQHLMDTDRKVARATHNITAHRILQAGTGITFEEGDDDGEKAAGGRLLHLMQAMDLWNVMVVVTRWYGGQKLGAARFRLINSVARDAFVKAGLVADQDRNQAGKKSKEKA